MEMGGDEFSKIGKPNKHGYPNMVCFRASKKSRLLRIRMWSLTLRRNDLRCLWRFTTRAFSSGVIPGGSSSKVLRADERFTGKLKDGTEFDWGIDDIPLDFDGPMAAGSMSGSGGIIVMDDSVDMVEAMANINAFYAHESCGQCTPCREGSLWMRKITQRMCDGGAREEDADLLLSVANQIEGRTICAFGEAAAWLRKVSLQNFVIILKKSQES